MLYEWFIDVYQRVLLKIGYFFEVGERSRISLWFDSVAVRSIQKQNRRPRGRRFLNERYGYRFPR